MNDPVNISTKNPPATVKMKRFSIGDTAKFVEVIQYLNLYIAYLLLFTLSFSQDLLPAILAAWFITSLLEGDFRNRFNFKELRQYKLLFYLLLAYYTYHLLGMLWTENVQQGIRHLQRLLSFLFIPLVFIGANRLYKKRVSKLLLSFVIGALSASVLCLVYAFYRSISLEKGSFVFDPVFNGPYNYFFYTPFSVFLHPQYFALYCLFAIVILFHLYHSNSFVKKQQFKIFSLFAISIFLITIFLLSSKAGIVSTALVLLGKAVIFIRQRLSILSVFTLILILASLFFIGENNARLQLFGSHLASNKKVRTTKVVRLLLWQNSIELISNNFWFGVGTGDISDELTAQLKKETHLTKKQKSFNSHNQFFSVFAAVGVGGFLLLLAIFIVPLVISLRNRYYLLAVFLAIMMFNFGVENMLNRISGLVFFLFFYNFLFLYSPQRIRFRF